MRISSSRFFFLIPSVLASLLSLPLVAQETKDSDEEKSVEQRYVVRIGGGEHGSHPTILGDFRHRGFLGVHLVPLTPELRAHFGVGEQSGVMVSRVVEGSPAAEAGILVGDIITAVDGERVSSAIDLQRAVRRKGEGELADVELWRDGRLEQLTVTITERDREAVFLGPDGSVHHLPVLPHLEDLHLEDVHIDHEALQEAMESVHETLRSGEWRERVKHLTEVDWQGLSEKMRQVEERLERLENELRQAEREEE